MNYSKVVQCKRQKKLGLHHQNHQKNMDAQVPDQSPTPTRNELFRACASGNYIEMKRILRDQRFQNAIDAMQHQRYLTDANGKNAL
jgi:hypothetical protein